MSAQAIKHISVWRIHVPAGECKTSVNQKLKSRVEALHGKVLGLRHIELGIDIGGMSDRSDAVLYSEFESTQALESYRQHPEHHALVELLDKYRVETRVVDYFIGDHIQPSN